MDKEPTPIPNRSQYASSHIKLAAFRLTSDETTTEDGGMSRRGHRGRLNDNTDDEDAGVDENGVLSGDDLSKEAGVECAEPGAEFEDGCQPTLLGLVRSVDAHVWIFVSASNC